MYPYRLNVKNERGEWLIATLRTARRRFPNCDPYIEDGQIFLPPKAGMSLQEAFGIPYALQKALEKDLEKN